MSSSKRHRGEGESSLPAIGRQGIEMLEGVPLFAALSRRAMRRLADVAQRAEYTPGAIVVAAGAPPGAAFFVIVEGEASVQRDNREIARLGPGEFFGELSLLDGRRRIATVAAAGPLVTIRLSRQAFRDLVASDPDVPFQIMEVLGRRIRALEDALGRAGVAHPAEVPAESTATGLPVSEPPPAVEAPSGQPE